MSEETTEINNDNNETEKKDNNEITNNKDNKDNIEGNTNEIAKDHVHENIQKYVPESKHDNNNTGENLEKAHLENDKHDGNLTDKHDKHDNQADLKIFGKEDKLFTNEVEEANHNDLDAHHDNLQYNKNNDNNNDNVNTNANHSNNHSNNSSPKSKGVHNRDHLQTDQASSEVIFSKLYTQVLILNIH